MTLPMTEPIRLFLCDDVVELRALMRIGMEEDERIDVVGEAGDALTGIAEIARLRPDVVLLDLSMPGLDGLEAIPRILAAAPETKIIVFSGFGAERMEDAALAQGALRYLEKGRPLDAVRAAVHEVADNRGDQGAPRAGGTGPDADDSGGDARGGPLRRMTGAAARGLSRPRRPRRAGFSEG
jgi:DNA-binding NarL/FixJ family response regulator